MGFFAASGFVTYFMFSVLLFSVDSYTFTIIDLTVIGFFFSFLKRTFWDGQAFGAEKKAHFIFFVLFGISVLLSGINPYIASSAPMIIQYCKTTAHLFYLMTLAFVCYMYPVSAKAWENGIKLFMIICLFVNIFGIYQVFARAYDLPFAWIEYDGIAASTGRFNESVGSFSQLSLKFGNFYRATSIFSEPSALASVNVYLLSFLIVPYVMKQAHFFKSKVFNVVSFAASVTATLMTFSMTGLFGLGVILAGLTLYERSARIFKIMYFVVPAVGIILIADIFTTEYFDISITDLFSDRLTGVANYSNGGEDFIEGESFGTRQEYFAKSFMIWQRYPLTGVGQGLTAYNGTVDLGFSDTSIMSTLAETGIIGSASYTAFLLGLFYSLYKKRHKDCGQSTDNMIRLTATAFFMLLNVSFVSYVTSNILIYFAFWLPVSMAVSVSRMHSAESERFSIKAYAGDYSPRKAFGNLLRANK